VRGDVEVTETCLYQGNLSDVNELLYTVPVGRRAVIKQISLENVGEDHDYVSLNIVPPGGTPSDSNLFLKSFHIGIYYQIERIIGESVEYGTWRPMDAGTMIYGSCENKNINITISGMLL
jgi:hypothetical protein